MPFALSQTAAPGHQSAAAAHAALKKNHPELAAPLLAELKKLPDAMPPFSRTDDRYPGGPTVYVSAVLAPPYPHAVTFAWEVRTPPPEGERIAYILDINVVALP